MELDRDLRSPLRNVQLIGELDLDPDSELYLKAKSASGRLIARRRFGSLARTCPAALSMFLVAEGIHRYAGGKYWRNVSVVGLQNPNVKTSCSGRAKPGCGAEPRSGHASRGSVVDQITQLLGRRVRW